jgi:pilus assembly protein CpaB
VNKKALLISLVTAIAGVLLAHFYLTRLEQEISGGPKMSVLIAATDLKPGTVLTESLLGVRSMPQAYVGERNISERDARKVVGVRISTRVKANEPILWSDVATLAAPGRDLSTAVQEGKRAIALNGSNVTFDGLLRPGDRVDVLFTRGAGDETSTLMQNVLVLSVGGRIEVDDGPGGIAMRSSRGAVTVSVSSEEGQLLTQAEQQGALTLVLRNPDDIAIVEGLPKTQREDVIPRVEQAARRTEAQPSKEIDHVR